MTQPGVVSDVSPSQIIRRRVISFAGSCGNRKAAPCWPQLTDFAVLVAAAPARF